MPAVIFSPTEILHFVIILLRVSGIIIFVPFFGSPSIPYQVRIAFALVTSLLLVPSISLNVDAGVYGLTDIVLVILGEIMAGIILGLAAKLVFAGIQFAGQLISFQMGFSLIKLIDPQTNVESSVFSFIHNYIGLLFFLLLNGHHWFLKAIYESFECMPVGGIHLQGALVESMIHLSSQIFVIGLRIAGPVIVVTIIADLVIGIIGRSAPQIHVLIVGLPLKLLVGFSCLSISMYFIPHYLETVFASLYKTIFSLVHTMS